MKKDELEKKIADLRENVRAVHFKGQGAKPKNVKETKNTKRQIARILTIMNEK